MVFHKNDEISVKFDFDLLTLSPKVDDSIRVSALKDTELLSLLLFLGPTSTKPGVKIPRVKSKVKSKRKAKVVIPRR